VHARLIKGDCRKVLKRLRKEGVLVDAVVTDTPYNLVSIQKRFGKKGAAAPSSDGPTGLYKRQARGFLGKAWDTDVAFDPKTWRRVYRVMKPGAYLIAFGGDKTHHRLFAAIEDAGFEIRRTIVWMYGSGAPMSKNVGALMEKAGDSSGAWQGWHTDLKPAMEMICLARKPLDGRIIDNVHKYGTGGLNIDGCRVPYANERDRKSAAEAGNMRLGNDAPGRARCGDGAYGFKNPKKSVKGWEERSKRGRWPANIIHDGSMAVLSGFAAAKVAADTDMVRFFYHVKATRRDRANSKHATVKPIGLLRYLVRLVTPPDGTVLDPFAGTGTLAAACKVEGFDCVLIEKDRGYFKDMKRRVKRLGL
jgi:site-specific DNA-methyltransferase (adenine-specific)